MSPYYDSEYTEAMHQEAEEVAYYQEQCNEAEQYEAYIEQQVAEYYTRLELERMLQIIEEERKAQCIHMQ